MSAKTHETMYQEIVEVSDKVCSVWEIDFLDSIEPRILRETLSDKQKAILERIYDKVCKSHF
jgi:hypothetical protein